MLKELISKGFLPHELPPLFSSKSLRALVGKGLPEAFTGTKAQWTQAVHHNLARPGGLRRKLTIPNPVNFFRLSKAMEDHAPLLKAEWSKSSFSKTSPKLGGSRALANYSNDRASPRADIRVGARYLVRADISQFYPSIYTHSVPWVLHTKAAAKAQIKVHALPGNVLDRELQACQYGQTKGIAIGPDTSLGIAELLLSPLDKRLRDECKSLGGVRFIDDMEFSFGKLSSAEAALAKLEFMLGEFELQLNGTKTKIVELPDEIESIYVTMLRPHVPARIGAPPSRWVDYFNRALVAARTQPEDGVLRYAVAALQGVLCSPPSWKLAQRLLWQCIAVDPGCLRFVVDVLLINNKTTGLDIDVAVASVAINALIQSSAPVNHGSEVVWSIWAGLLLKLLIEPESQTAIALMDDALVACAATIAWERKLFDAGFESTLWASWIVKGSFSQDHWLFVYEALKRGWYSANVKVAKLEVDVNAAFLVAMNVSFIEDNIIDSYVPAKLPTSYGGGNGGY